MKNSLVKRIFTLAVVVTLCFSSAIIAKNKVKSKVYASELGAGDLVCYWSNRAGVLDIPISDSTNETYKESDRKWLGLPTIAKTKGGRLWCAFQTGDVKEGSEGTNNYDVMYYSDDNGETWSNEYAIFDVANHDIRLTDPRLFMDNFGDLWLVLIRGGAKGTYAIKMINPDCEDPSNNLQFAKPIWWLNYPPAHRPTILSNGRWITPVEGGVKNQHTYICNPDNENGVYVWHDITQTPATTGYPNNKPFGEAQVLELKDGRLMMLSRLPKNYGNGLEISYSDDFGVNWTPYQGGHELPLAGPSSKFHIQRLKSGNILLLNHDSLTDRHNITAWLSEDDGKTWPYKILLDDRKIDGAWGVSYPESANEQGSNGEIYVVYDAGRYTQKEIRMCIITEEDIKAGEPVSEYAKMRIPVVKCGGFTDIAVVKENVDRYQYFDIGTTEQSIVNSLPETLNLVDEKGVPFTASGDWLCDNFNPSKAGRYTFEFITTDIPKGVQDGYSLFKVYVGIGIEDPLKSPDISDSSNSSVQISTSDNTNSSADEKGCKGALGITLAGILAVVASLGAVFVLKQKNKFTK